MTASASVPDAVTPISGSRQVTSLQCLTISCAVCDLAAWEEYVVHFYSERELREWISGEGWTVRRGRHSALPDPFRRRRLRRERSRLGRLVRAHSDPETEYRYCEHCSAGEGRRRISGTAPAVRYPAPSRVHPTQA